MSAPRPGNPDPSGGIDILASNAQSVIVGCVDGSLVRLERKSGAVLARSNALRDAFVYAIQPVGTCAYAVTAIPHQTAASSLVEILGCKRLNVIMQQRADTMVLGAIGETAVLDHCCFRARKIFRPETISTVDLTNGAQSAGINVLPARKRYQSAWAILHHQQLYVSADSALYYYGDPRDLPTAASRVDVGGMPIGDGRYAEQTSNLAGARTTSVVQLDGPSVKTIWTVPSEGIRDPSYDIATGSLVYQFGHAWSGAHDYVRLSDRKRVTLRPGCWPMASDETELVALCPAPVSGNTGAQNFSAYRWR